MFYCTYSTGDDNDPVRVPTVTVRPSEHAEPPEIISYDDLNRLTEISSKIWDTEVAPGVWESVESDAMRGGSFHYPDDVNSWSPLRLRPELFGVLERRFEFLDNYTGARNTGSHEGSITVGSGSDLHLPVLSIGDGREDVYGAIAFLHRGFVAVVPPAASSVSLDFRAHTQQESDELNAARDSLQELGDGGDIEEFIWWRVYYGSNTQRSDGVSRFKRWFRPVVGGAVGLTAVLVGTAGLVLRKKPPRRDIMATRRVASSELKFRDYVECCPQLTPDSRAAGHAVVAIHGTMACGLPIASELHDLLKGKVPVYRYEHDTWLRLGDNWDELRQLIKSLDAASVTLIAHSRGGLVAEKVASLYPSVRAISLGTPFFGTPLIEAAQGSMIGTKALLGVIRAASGTLWIDIPTFFLGIVVGELPQGLLAMHTNSDLSDDRRLGTDSAVTIAFAGTAPSGDVDDSYGVHFLRKAADTGMMPNPHDLVVPHESAGGRVDEVIDVTTDHFSYLTQSAVRQRIEEFLRGETGRDITPVPPSKDSVSF